MYIQIQGKHFKCSRLKCPTTDAKLTTKEDTSVLHAYVCCQFGVHWRIFLWLLLSSFELRAIAPPHCKWQLKHRGSCLCSEISTGPVSISPLLLNVVGCSSEELSQLQPATWLHEKLCYQTRACLNRYLWLSKCRVGFLAGWINVFKEVGGNIT